MDGCECIHDTTPNAYIGTYVLSILLAIKCHLWKVEVQGTFYFKETDHLLIASYITQINADVG